MDTNIGVNEELVRFEINGGIRFNDKLSNRIRGQIPILEVSSSFSRNRLSIDLFS